MTPLLGAPLLALLLSQAVPAPESRTRDAADAAVRLSALALTLLSTLPLMPSDALARA